MTPVTQPAHAVAPPHLAPAQPAAVAPPPPLAQQPARRRPAWRVWLWVAGVLTVLLAGGVYAGTRKDVREAIGIESVARTESSNKGGGVAVNTVLPVKKTLSRTLEQPGTVRPLAQAELYAKVSGNLSRIQRDLPPRQVALLTAQALAANLLGGGPLDLACWTVPVRQELDRAPVKDIGSVVQAGEIVMEIDAPELLQEISQKESLWYQARAELEQARANQATFSAMVEAADADLLVVQSDISRAVGDHSFAVKQRDRYKVLVADKGATPDNLDEKEKQLEAAQAALEAARAKAKSVQAQKLVALAKLAAAKADIIVKEARVRVAHDDLLRAQILEDYTLLRAPFDGVITSRDVDEGDFISNSSTRTDRPLMTITALDKVSIVLQVPERDAVWVREGEEATVRVDARDGWTVKGRVARTSHVLEPRSRTLRTEIDVDNPGHLLLPGMYGHVELTLQKVEGAMAIPATAVVGKKGGSTILLVKDGKVVSQPVKIVFDDGKELAVVKLVGGKEVPLAETDEVVVSNKGELRDGQKVRAKRLDK